MLILQYTDQIKLFLSLPKSSHISKNLQKDTSKIWLWDQAYLYAPLKRAFLIVPPVHFHSQMYTHQPCLRTCLVRTSKKGNNSPSNVFFDVVKLLMFLSFNPLGSLFIRIL